jgi:phosphoribosylcarboxyaminoimidazole (NCAIR) mutase
VIRDTTFRRPTILSGSAVGVPVGTLAIGKTGATYAALPAVSILSLTRPELRERLGEVP